MNFLASVLVFAFPWLQFAPLLTPTLRRVVLQEFTWKGVFVRMIGSGVIEGDVVGIEASESMIAAAKHFSPAERRIMLFDAHSGQLIRKFGRCVCV